MTGYGRTILYHNNGDGTFWQNVTAKKAVLPKQKQMVKAPDGSASTKSLARSS